MIDFWHLHRASVFKDGDKKDEQRFKLQLVLFVLVFPKSIPLHF